MSSSGAKRLMVVRAPIPTIGKKLFDVSDRLIVHGIGISFSRPYIVFFLPEVKRKALKVTVRRQILKRV